MTIAFRIVEAVPAGKRGRRNHVWTDEEREIVRRDYDGTNAGADRIAARLGVTRYAVKGMAYKLGVGKITDRRRWTPEEDERLTELITQYAPKDVARLMGRGLNSVVVRSKRLGLSRRVRDGWYTKREVCEILGVDHGRVQRWMDSGELRAVPHGSVRPQQGGGALWHIREADLRAFIIRNAGELNGRNVDLVQIVDILTPLRAAGVSL